MAVVEYEKKDGIGYLTLNKPEKLNALRSSPTGGEWNLVHDAWAEAQQDDDIKVLVMQGKGRAFCVGADMSYLGQQYYDKVDGKRVSQRTYLKYDRAIVNRERDYLLSPKITIAKVQNYAVGGGMRLAMYCDMIVAAEGAVFQYPEARMIGPYAPVIGLFYHKLGPALFMECFTTGRRMYAEDLLARGAINRVVPMEKLDEETEKLAKAVCLAPADGLYIGKLGLHVMYENLGITATSNWGFMIHTLQVQQRLGPGEWNIFKARQEGGARGVFESRDKRYEGLVP